MVLALIFEELGVASGLKATRTRRAGMIPGRDRRPDLVLVPEKSGPECTGSSGPEEFCTWPMSDFLWSGSDFLWSRSDFLWSGSDFLWSGSISIWTRENDDLDQNKSGPGHKDQIWSWSARNLAGRPFFFWSRRKNPG